MEGLAGLLKARKQIKAPKYEWQDVALNIIKQLPDSYKCRASVFKCCKDDLQSARKAAMECKELDKNHVLYFLKVYNKFSHGTVDNLSTHSLSPQE
jgi:hypothetical protein